jgi:hypothetical protein
MAAIAPGRLHDVSNAADFVALTATNAEGALVVEGSIKDSA